MSADETSEITARLRGHYCVSPMRCTELADDAAREIERLRALITTVVDTCESSDGGTCAHAPNEDGDVGPIFGEQTWQMLVEVAYP
jgi:hypothetical protein